VNEAYSQPVVDRHGNVMFYCSYCGTPICSDDVLDLCMRLPDFGESADDYRDAELIEGFQHRSCLAASNAS
jgi:hypothetical protein